MSAREWYICPFCKSEINKAKEEYGKIPMDKFIEKYKSAMSQNWDGEEFSPDDEETVRMDGEEWLGEDGCYHIEHGMDCNNCGRTWSISVKVHPTMDDKQGKSKLTFKIPSKSGGEDHEVEVEGDKWKCDCVSFKTRKKCSHIEKAKEQYKRTKGDKDE